MPSGWWTSWDALRRKLWPYRVDRRGGERVALGNRGEDLAAAHLKRQGLKILGRNVTLRFGEIDIVAQTPDGVIVIVEVKARHHHPQHRPERQVNAVKKRKLRGLASALLKLKGWRGRAVRFDVIAVDFHEDGRHELRHHVNAFGPRGAGGPR